MNEEKNYSISVNNDILNGKERIKLSTNSETNGRKFIIASYHGKLSNN